MICSDLVGKFVTGLFELNRDFGRFQNHLRDFLVQIKEFSGGDDNARLYLAEEVIFLLHYLMDLTQLGGSPAAEGAGGLASTRPRAAQRPAP